MTGTIIISLFMGFVVLPLIAIVAYKLNDKNSSRPILIIDRKSNDLDLSKLRFIQETEFWKNYHKE